VAVSGERLPADRVRAARQARDPGDDRVTPVFGVDPPRENVPLRVVQTDRVRERLDGLVEVDLDPVRRALEPLSRFRVRAADRGVPERGRRSDERDEDGEE
jgi:hypothetical protein